MTRSFQVQPLSLLIGFGLAAIVFVSMGQIPAHRVQLANARCEEVVPHPRDFVRIKEGVPFRVPAGRVFVPTALGNKILDPQIVTPPVELTVDGEQMLRGSGNGAVNMASVPTVLAVPAGSVVEVLGGNPAPDDGDAWGYLLDA